MKCADCGKKIQATFEEPAVYLAMVCKWVCPRCDERRMMVKNYFQRKVGQRASKNN